MSVSNSNPRPNYNGGKEVIASDMLTIVSKELSKLLIIKIINNNRCASGHIHLSVKKA